MRQDNQSTEPTLGEVMQVVIDSNLTKLHTTAPAKIVSYDPATQYGSVQMQIMVAYENGTLIKRPVIPNVPIAHLRAAGGQMRMHIPVAVGDDCVLHFTERSLDNWKTQGGLTDPADRRKFDLSDCFAVMGGSSIPDAFTVSNAQAIEIINSASVIQMLPDGTINLGSTAPTHAVALADMVLARIQALEMSYSSLITTFNSHMHPTSAPGAPTGPPASPASSYTAPSDPLGSMKVMVSS